MLEWSTHILSNNPWTNKGSNLWGVKISADIPVEVTYVEGPDLGLQKNLKK
jgi:hypothetical protein